MNKSAFALLAALLAAPAVAQDAAEPAPAGPGEAPAAVVTEGEPPVVISTPPTSEAKAAATTTAEGAAQLATPPPLPAPPPPPPPPPPRMPTWRAPPEHRSPRRYGDAGAPFTFGIGTSYVFRSDVGYDRIGAGKRQQQLDLFASYDVLQPTAKLVVAAGLNYRFGSDGANSDLEVVQHLLSAELTARYQLLRWLHPQLRAGLGFSRLAARLDAAQTANLEAFETAPVGTFAAGLLLRTPARAFETYNGRLSSVSLGVLVEGGYSVTRNLPIRPRADSEQEIPIAAPALGHLDASAAFLRLMFVVRF